MKIATSLINSFILDSIIFKHKGMISEDKRNGMTCLFEVLTNAPITPFLKKRDNEKLRT